MTKIGIGLGIFGLSLLTMGCAHPIKIDERMRELDTAQLIVSLRTFHAKNMEVRLVPEEESLHNGDFVYFTLRANQQAYLYVVLFGADGSSRTLFPTPQYQLAPARCALRVPIGKTLNLTDPAGIDSLRVVASLKPLAEADRGLCDELRLNCDPPAKDSKPAVAPCVESPQAAQELRGPVTAVKTGRAENNGIAQTRFLLRHDR